MKERYVLRFEYAEPFTLARFHFPFYSLARLVIHTVFTHLLLSLSRLFPFSCARRLFFDDPVYYTTNAVSIRTNQSGRYEICVHVENKVAITALVCVFVHTA